MILQKFIHKQQVDLFWIKPLSVALNILADLLDPIPCVHSYHNILRVSGLLISITLSAICISWSIASTPAAIPALRFLALRYSHYSMLMMFLFTCFMHFYSWFFIRPNRTFNISFSRRNKIIWDVSCVTCTLSLCLAWMRQTWTSSSYLD